MVPFLQAQSTRGSLAPSSHSSSSGVAGQQSNSISKSTSAGQNTGGTRSGSLKPARQDSLEDGLAQLAQRDWQLNLDALEVSSAVDLWSNSFSSSRLPFRGRNVDASLVLREVHLPCLEFWDVMQAWVIHAG